MGGGVYSNFKSIIYESNIKSNKLTLNDQYHGGGIYYPKTSDNEIISSTIKDNKTTEKEENVYNDGKLILIDTKLSKSVSNDTIIV